MVSFTNSQQVKVGATLSYIGVVVYILIGLLYTPWMIKVIGKDDYGLYTLAYSIISFFLFDFGLSATIQRYVAKYLAEGDERKVNNCVSNVCKLYVFIDVLILIVLVLFIILVPSIYKDFTIEQLNRLKILLILVGSFSVISFPFIPINGILSAHEKFIQLKSCDLLSKVITVLSIVISLSLGGGLFSIVIVNITIGLLAIFIKYLIVRKETTISIDWNYKNKNEMISMLSFSGWTTVTAICQRSIFNIAPTILGLFSGAKEIAVLGVAISLEAYTFTLAYSLNGLFFSRISRILNTNESILPLMIKVGRIQIIIMGLIVIGFVLIGKDFINIWIGSGYDDTFYCTLLFIIPAFLLLPADIADQTLTASGNVKFRAYVFICMLVINLALSYYLTSVYGIMGLALSIFIAYLVRTIALYYVYYKILHLDIFLFIKETFLQMSIGLIGSFGVCYYIVNLFDSCNNWLFLIFKVVLIIMIYLFMIYMFSLNAKEKTYFSDLIKKAL